jgi:hypothetical protein
MPLQNRVSPAGDIFADPARGTFMGNRGGAIHDAERRIIRPYATRRWITCVLEFKGRRRTIMAPGRYTELFFLDEAVSLAAGHRPARNAAATASMLSNKPGFVPALTGRIAFFMPIASMRSCTGRGSTV